MQPVKELGPYEPFYCLLEEARESWNHALSDKIVYLRDPIKVAGNAVTHIAKNYIKGNIWIECHLTFEIQRTAYHVLVVIEAQKSLRGARYFGKAKIELVAMNRNSPVLVDVAQAI